MGEEDYIACQEKGFRLRLPKRCIAGGRSRNKTPGYGGHFASSPKPSARKEGLTLLRFVYCLVATGSKWNNHDNSVLPIDKGRFIPAAACPMGACQHDNLVERESNYRASGPPAVAVLSRPLTHRDNGDTTPPRVQDIISMHVRLQSYYCLWTPRELLPVFKLASNVLSVTNPTK